MTQVGTAVTRVALGVLLGLAPASVAGAETAWIHASVETQGSVGGQVTTFRGFTTSDQAGTTRIPVSRLCIKGMAHKVQDKCEDNVSSIELVEQATGLPGVGSLCVEALATATWKTIPLTATARACP